MISYHPSSSVLYWLSVGLLLSGGIVFITGIITNEIRQQGIGNWWSYFFCINTFNKFDIYILEKSYYPPVEQFGWMWWEIFRQPFLRLSYICISLLSLLFCITLPCIVRFLWMLVFPVREPYCHSTGNIL